MRKESLGYVFDYMDYIYTKIHEELKSKEGDLKDKKSVIEIYENALKKIETIEIQYYESDIEGKRKIIGSIFPKKFQFENKKVRTADINPLFLKIASINSDSQGIKKGTNSKKLNLSRMVGDIDLSSNQMLEFLEFFNNEKE